MPRPSPFRCFKTHREVIRLAVMMHMRFPLSLGDVEDLLQERGIEICHESAARWCGSGGTCSGNASGRVPAPQGGPDADLHETIVAVRRGFREGQRRQARPVAGGG
jgi:hypothetical protein